MIPGRGRLHSRGRYDNLDEIRTLDPYDDADRDRIVTLTARHDLPWDFDQGVAIAFLRDYGIPSISRLLDRTRQFEIWFTRILVNACLDRVKARKRRFTTERLGQRIRYGRMLDLAAL